jgi:phospholipid/cholesterol/gamma-HCH transport system substrate-binding protein
MSRERIDIAVGAFVLAAFTIVMWGSLQLGILRDWTDPGGRTFLARFDDVSGLREQAHVVVAGVPVGRVERLALVGRSATVTLRIEESSLEIPVDTVASIRSKGLLGEKLLDLTPGASAQLLEDGGVLTRTEEAADLDHLVNRLGSVVEDVQRVSATFRNVLGSAEGEESLHEIVANARSVTADLRRVVDENEDRVERILVSLETFSDDVEDLSARNRDGITSIVTNLERASANLDTSIEGLARLSERVEGGEGTLGRLLSDEELYSELDSALGEARAALREVRRAAEETQEQVPATILTTVLGSLF